MSDKKLGFHAHMPPTMELFLLSTSPLSTLFFKNQLLPSYYQFLLQGSLGSTTSASTALEELVSLPELLLPSSGSIGSSPRAMLIRVNTFDA
mmetsp:Transcript_29047/g.78228  ORF Transcript_29047/g.78228 Transcript_29047/m.78228 type:complete len:92 (-) Transcript_29047:2296-2571(-)